MVATLELQVEVVGCPTVCRHCWAQGVPYPAMPVADVAWVLEEAHRFCDDHRLGFGAYPMHELAAHPQAVELLRPFADHGDAAEFEPLATTGVPLAVREDWQELLAAAATLAQPDMRALIQAALELGWTLWRYEADIDHAPAALVQQGLLSQAFTNWREAEQAHNLAGVLAGLAASDRLLVEEAGPLSCWPGVDALIVSTDNAMT